MRSISHDEVMAETFRNDPRYAMEFLNSILEDGDDSELRTALRQMTQAFAPELAVSQEAPPEPRRLDLTDVAAVLRPLGFRLTVQTLAPPQTDPLDHQHAQPPTPEITAPQNAL